MRKHFEIGVGGMSRRAVMARYTELDNYSTPQTKEEIDAYLRVNNEINAAIRADFDTNRGAEIEKALTAALDQAVARGARGVDALAEAAATDPTVLEIINRQGSAAVILRQLVGLVLATKEDALFAKGDEDGDDGLDWPSP